MTAADNNRPPAPDYKAKKKRKRNFLLALMVIVIFLAAVGWFLFWLFIGRFYVSTEDAYVHGNQVMLTPQVTAGVQAIYAEETDLVKQGQLVVQLDPSDHAIAFEERREELAQIVRQVSGLFLDVNAKEAEVVLREAQLRQQKLDLEHRRPLVETGAVSVEEFEIYETKVIVAEANVTFAEQELQMAQALVEGTTIDTHPLVLEAVWNLKQAYLNVVRCQILAPSAGYIAKRTVQVGDQVSIGDTLLYIVPLDEIWIEANYKETHLSRVRIGQPVTYTADMYGRNVEFHGNVVGFQPGSGNAFALLPPENAAGNWIKIIQRVPVRISVNQDEIRKHPLLLGLSMRVSVDVHDTSERMLADIPTKRPLYTTPIYLQQFGEMCDVESLIAQIIEQNRYDVSAEE